MEAIDYYLEGYGCGECILMAARDRFGVDIGREELRLVGALGGGMGLGLMCGVPLACVGVLGLVYGEGIALKEKRLRFLLAFKEGAGGLNCGEIGALASEEACKRAVELGWGILVGLVEEG